MPDMEKLVAVSDLDERLLSQENKKKVKNGLKIAAIVFGVIVAIDIISMLIYFIFFGAPH